MLLRGLKYLDDAPGQSFAVAPEGHVSVARPQILQFEAVNGGEPHPRYEFTDLELRVRITSPDYLGEIRPPLSR
jgi:hypothetical protein